MLKRLLLAALVAAAAWVAWRYWPTDAPQAPSAEMQTLTATGNGTQKAGLALKAITLNQGEGGLEIWRLKATWAGMESRQGGVLVHQPRLTYFMNQDNTELHVSADSGDIDQDKQILRFIGNVAVDLENRFLTGSLLVYTGKDRSMTFPDGADFQGEGVSGRADHVQWLLNNRVITADGNVQVNFENSPAVSSGGSEKE